jgi:IS1 family transposase
MDIMNRMNTTRRAQVIRCLIEGNSINSTVRMTGVAKNTVLKLLVEIGAACSEYMDENMRNLTCKRLQADEAWSFCFAKAKNVKPSHFDDGGYAGDVWAWVAIDADTKLIPTWRLGNRDSATAKEFISDLAGRLANRVQLTTDGLKVYINAVIDAFGTDIDYSVLHKIYGADRPDAARYSPAQCIGCEKKSLIGKPDPDHISTSYIERQNLTMRMSMRRFTRLTNGFSKKMDNHAASVALYMMYYNFGRKHQTLGTTPAVKAGVADHIWSVEEIIGVLEKSEPKATRPAKAAVSN